MLRLLVPVAVLCMLPTLAAAQDFTISVTPSTAKIYRPDPAGNKPQIGVGTARFKVEKDKPNTVIIEATGYVPVMRTFTRGEKYPKIVEVPLEDRLVKLTAMPYDAQVFVNGRAVGRQTVDVVVEKGKTATVELKKPGFFTVTRTYQNLSGSENPPVEDRMDLVDRMVLVTSSPAGAAILVDGNNVGETSAEVIVPAERCVTARVARPGFAPVEKTYCNREQAPVPPLNDNFTLRDRVTTISATPMDAALIVNGRQIGSGTGAVIVPENGCIDVMIRLEGYIGQKKVFCNQDNVQVPPVDEFVQLAPDEAFSSAVSVKSDQANVNFTIEVGANRTADQAWRTLSQIVLSYFDVLEITDRETGYLRTAWVFRTFESGSPVRTRLIVKLGNSDPLKYVVKISSEIGDRTRNEGRPVGVKDDDAFREWDRILNAYKDIINEMQARLR
jgi:hypothetical protein